MFFETSLHLPQRLMHLFEDHKRRKITVEIRTLICNS